MLKCCISLLWLSSQPAQQGALCLTPLQVRGSRSILLGESSCGPKGLNATQGFSCTRGQVVITILPGKSHSVFYKAHTRSYSIYVNISQHVVWWLLQMKLPQNTTFPVGSDFTSVIDWWCLPDTRVGFPLGSDFTSVIDWWSARHQGGGGVQSRGLPYRSHPIPYYTWGLSPDAASEKAVSPREDSGVRHSQGRAVSWAPFGSLAGGQTWIWLLPLTS